MSWFFFCFDFKCLTDSCVLDKGWCFCAAFDIWTRIGCFCYCLEFFGVFGFVLSHTPTNMRSCVFVWSFFCTNTLKLDEPMLCRTFIYHTVEITMNIIASMNGCCVIWQLKIEFSWNFMIRIPSLLSFLLHSLMLVGAFISFVLELKRTNPFVEWANI